MVVFALSNFRHVRVSVTLNTVQKFDQISGDFLFQYQKPLDGQNVVFVLNQSNY